VARRVHGLLGPHFHTTTWHGRDDARHEESRGECEHPARGTSPVADLFDKEAVMGTSIIVILLVPLLFQVFILRQEQKKRHLEVQERLARIEAKLGS
jgi:hypothetical protein